MKCELNKVKGSEVMVVGTVMSLVENMSKVDYPWTRLWESSSTRLRTLWGDGSECGARFNKQKHPGSLTPISFE